MTASIAMTTSAAMPTPSGPSTPVPGSGLSFHDLLSIVNPLQHIPIVSTIYRAITGDTIGPVERIAGDTLYGGMWGFVSSVANVAFQEATGKDFGDTALALLEGNYDGTSNVADNLNSTSPVSSSAALAAVAMPANTTAALAANGPPTPLQSSTAPAAMNDTAMTALMNALSEKGVDPALSQRALTAYRKSVTAPPAVLVPTS